jgi:Putative zinc-finger
MTEDKHKLSLLGGATGAEDAEQHLGRLLSQKLGDGSFEQHNCLSSEDIAALVDGSLPEEERDEMMKHLSTCNSCYEVYLLTANLVQQEESLTGIKTHSRITMLKPLALAASLLIVIFSIYFFYKSDSIPKTSQEFFDMSETDSTASGDAAMESEEVIVTGKSPIIDSRKTALPKKNVALSESVSPKEDAVVADKEFSKDLPRMAGGKEMKLKPVSPPPSASAFRRQKVKASQKMMIGKVDESQSLTQSAEKKEKKLRKLSKFKSETIAEVRKKDAKKVTKKRYDTDDGYRMAEQTKASKPQSAPTPSAPLKLPAHRASLSELDPVVLINQLNLKTQMNKGFLPAREIKSLFKKTLILSKQVKLNKKMNPQQFKPILKVISDNGSTTIFPNMHYFLSRSAPGSIEQQFFTLAQSGWCDQSGACYSASGMKPQWSSGRGEGSREQLLRQWQSISPKLTGTFKEIALQTISHLKQD